MNKIQIYGQSLLNDYSLAEIDVILKASYPDSIKQTKFSTTPDGEQVLNVEYYDEAECHYMWFSLMKPDPVFE